VKNSSLEVILMVMLAQLEGGLRGYMEVLDMANRIKRENLEAYGFLDIFALSVPSQYNHHQCFKLMSES
jgi:hypothetical protein